MESFCVRLLNTGEFGAELNCSEVVALAFGAIDDERPAPFDVRLSILDFNSLQADFMPRPPCFTCNKRILLNACTLLFSKILEVRRMSSNKK